MPGEFSRPRALHCSRTNYGCAGGFWKRGRHAGWLRDDVGLGKTIEAGLVFWPLIANGTVRRLLIICPASLVEQWNQRLRAMFDIRVAIYAGDADTERTDFWGTHDKVTASLQKLRIERRTSPPTARKRALGLGSRG